MRTLLVKIREYNSLLDTYFLTQERLDAIRECVYDLFDDPRFECFLTSSGLIVQYREGSYTQDIPEEWMEKTFDFGWKGTRKEIKLIGDWIPVELRQVDPHGWGKMYLKFIDFEDIDAE